MKTLLIILLLSIEPYPVPMGFRIPLAHRSTAAGKIAPLVVAIPTFSTQGVPAAVSIESGHWTHPGTIMEHLLGEHSFRLALWSGCRIERIPELLAGRSQAELLTIHDRCHEGRKFSLVRNQRVKAGSKLVSAPSAYLAATRTDGFTVLVGAEWCAPCKALRAKMDAEKREYVYIDYDAYPELARYLSGGKTIPKVMEYRRQDGRLKLVRPVQSRRVPARQTFR